MCPRCIRLRAEYERLVSGLSMTTQALHAKARSSLLPEEFEKLAITAKETWAESERARLDIEQHAQTHRDTLWE
jgi:hypothetical protein